MSASFASAAVAFLADRSVAFAVVFLVLGAVWLLVRRFLSAELSSLWFLAPLVVLVLPLEAWIPNPWARANPIESAFRAVLPQSVGPLLLDAATEGFLDFPERRVQVLPIVEAAPAAQLPLEAASSPISLPPITASLFVAWALALVFFAARFLRGQRTLASWLHAATCLDPAALGIDLDDLKRRAGLRQSLALLETPELESPAVSAGRDAAILLPEGLAARLSADELTWVLLHELAHLARRDERTELVQRLLGAAFFFHPLVWASSRIARAHRELACDDRALSWMGTTERPRCARALFEVVAHATRLAERPGSRSRTPHAMASLFHSKKLLRTRIMRLVEPHRPLTRGLRAGALVVLTLTCGVALAAARFPAVSLQGGGEEPHELPKAESTVAGIRAAATLATDWLLKAQDENGGWSRKLPESPAAGGSGWGVFVKGEAGGGAPAPRIEPEQTDMALTGMALLALLERAALDPADERTAAAIDKAVAFLVASLNPDTGVFGSMDPFSFIVGHALATEALARASIGNMTDLKLWTLKSAVQALERGRNPYSAWRYNSPPDGQNDSRVTGQVLLALSAAFDAGAPASPDAFAWGMSYLSEVEDRETGRTGYLEVGDFALRLAGRQKAFPAEYAEVPTAMHLRLRCSAGLASVKSGAIELARDVLRGNLPTWDVERGTIDFDYWWQGTEALAASLPHGAAWAAWRSSLVRAIVTHQIREGDLAGTWPLVDAWSMPGLEVYATAANALSLYAVLSAE